MRGSRPSRPGIRARHDACARRSQRFRERRVTGAHHGDYIGQCCSEIPACERTDGLVTGACEGSRSRADRRSHFRKQFFTTEALAAPRREQNADDALFVAHARGLVGRAR
jgi:hypothetical protein